MRQDRDEEALQCLSKAVQSDSQNHMAHYYYASLLQQLSAGKDKDDRKAQFEVMRTHLKKSIEIAPYYVQAYELLGYVGLMLQDELDDVEARLSKAISIAPGRESLRITLAQVMMSNNKVIAARTVLNALYATTASASTRSRTEELLNYIANRLQSEQAMKEYEGRRRAAGLPAQIPNETSSRDDGPPRIARTGVPPTEPGPTTNARLRFPQPTVQGPQVEGLLTAIDCASGMTLQVRVGNSSVLLHTDNPSKIDFVSNVSSVKDSIGCGPVKPELKVLITYKRGGDPNFLGEPLVVEFRD